MKKDQRATHTCCTKCKIKTAGLDIKITNAAVSVSASFSSHWVTEDFRLFLILTGGSRNTCTYKSYINVLECVKSALPQIKQCAWGILCLFQCIKLILWYLIRRRCSLRCADWWGWRHPRSLNICCQRLMKLTLLTVMLPPCRLANMPTPHTHTALQ